MGGGYLKNRLKHTIPDAEKPEAEKTGMYGSVGASDV
jgi:hypothetical protein